MAAAQPPASALAPGLLVAAPALSDPNFAGSLVLMAEHHGEGALGFVVNRPGPITVADVLDGLDGNLRSVAEARGRAQTLANETREKAARAAEARRKEVDAKLQARIAEAEKTIAATRSAAMANVQGIASDTAPAIVQRLAGITPANDEVTEAVRNVLKH